MSLLLAATVFVCVFAVYPSLNAPAKSEPAKYDCILNLWHIDSFDGGKGSRAVFLKDVASQFQRENEGVFILVTVHTQESAARAVASGEVPDLLSFGCGTGFAADLVRILPSEMAGATLAGQTCAAAWCRGAYFLFTAEGDFSDVTPQNTVLSVGRGASTAGAAYMAGLRGTFHEQRSVQAYLTLLQGKCKYMLGTQRDVWRYAAREFTVQAKPLAEYSDLVQYIAVCSEDMDNYDASVRFIELLLSEQVQQTLSRIGMLSATGISVYAGEQPLLAEAETSAPNTVVSPWLSEEAFRRLCEDASGALRGDENSAKNFQNTLAQTL